MFVETFEDNPETYERFEQDDWQKLKGKRTNHGQIVGWTNAEGELHPAYLETDEGRYLTPGDLRHNVEFDGRHNVIELDSVDDTEDTDDSEDHDSEEVQLVTDGGQEVVDTQSQPKTAGGITVEELISKLNSDPDVYRAFAHEMKEPTGIEVQFKQNKVSTFFNNQMREHGYIAESIRTPGEDAGVGSLEPDFVLNVVYKRETYQDEVVTEAEQ